MSHNRNYKTKQINQRLSCTAFELSVGDILSLLFAASDFILPQDNVEYMTEISYRVFNDERYLKTSLPIKKINDEDKELIFKFWMEVNKEFFNPELTELEKKKKKHQEEKGIIPITELKKVYYDLSIEVNVMLINHKANVLDMPLSIYKKMDIAMEKINEAMQNG